MGLKVRKNVCLLSLLCFSTLIFLKLLFNNTEGTRQLHQSAVLVQKADEQTDSSRSNSQRDHPTADSVNELTNISSAFQSEFCDYRIHPLQNKPHICLFKKQDDVYVSAAVMAGSLWDITGVATVLNHMLWLRSSNENVVLIDLGANIGTFTIPSLAYGFQTIAVEPMPATMKRLATSIYLNNFSKLAQVHLKAISDRKGCVEARVNEKNKGGSEVDMTDCTSDGDLRATTLDDVMKDFGDIDSQSHLSVVLKVDVQRFEPYAIKGGMKLLRSGKVKLIYIEWAEMGKVYRSDFNPNNDPEMNAYKDLVEECMVFLLFEMKYQVYSHEGKQLHWGKDKSSWTNNIYLVLPGIWQKISTRIPTGAVLR